MLLGRKRWWKKPFGMRVTFWKPFCGENRGGNSTRVLRSQIFGAQNLDESHHWAFVSKDAEECFQGAGLQACRLTCELEQLEILSSIHSKLHFSEKLVEGLHGQSLSHALTKETLIQQELTPSKKKRENKNKRKNTVSVSVQRIYLGTFCQIPKIPRSTRMVAWLC